MTRNERRRKVRDLAANHLENLLFSTWEPDALSEDQCPADLRDEMREELDAAIRWLRDND